MAVVNVDRKNPSESRLSLPQVRKLLESLGEENLGQFQRRTFDYVSKFSKVDAEASEELVEKLTTDFGLDEMEAIQIVNCMPTSAKELRIFLAGGRRIVETTKLKAMLKLLNEHRKLK